MSVEQKRTTVRNIFVKYTSFSKREAERVVLEATNEMVEAIATALPSEAKAIVEQVFNEIRVKEGQTIQNRQIKEPAPMLDGDVVAEETATEDVAGLDAD